MLNKFRRYNTAAGLIDPGDAIICAVSGGADSMALLGCLLALREEYALWHGTAAQLAALDTQVYGKRVTPYGVEALVRRDAMPAGDELAPVSIEELFVLMVKGECAE